MTISLPLTSPSAYLTGTAALSIPADDGHVTDWHFDAAFLTPGTRYRVSGVNILDTTPLLGDFGVRECADALKRRAVPLPEGATFYAANTARAVLDLLLDTTAKHQQSDFIEVDALFEVSELPSILDQLAGIREKLSDSTQLRLIDQWTRTQREKASTLASASNL